MIGIGGLLAALAVPATSFAGTVSSDGSNISYVAATGEQNVVTVGLSGGNYTISDMGTGVALTVTAPCSLTTPTSATCPQPALPDIDHLSVSAGDMDDTLTVNAMPRDGTRIDGGDGNDTITGSAGPDKILGGPGDDVIDPTDALGVDFLVCINDPDFTDITIAGCPDFIDGGLGFNTLIYNAPAFNNPPHGLVIDAGGRSLLEGVAVTDPARPSNGDSRSNVLAIGTRGAFHTSRLVGTQGDDEIYGTQENDTLVGRGGGDVLCGGYGEDTVDYSGSGGPVNVSLNTNLPPDARWKLPLDSDWSRARGDCRQADAQGEPQPSLEKDCIADDGEPGEGDCVGVDTENVIGSPFGDHLVGDSPGLYVHVAAFFAPRGNNVLDGGGGDDTLDGLLGADVLIGGAGSHDTVSYASETLPVKVSLDGAENDGSTADVNPDNGKGDSVGTDVENITGGPGDDVLDGSSSDNTLLGGDGSDTIMGEGGDDVIDGQAGDDEGPAPTYDTRLFGGPGNDLVQGGAGDDTLDGGLGADTLDGADAADALDEGEDAVDYSNTTTPVYAAPDGLPNDGSATDLDTQTGLRDDIKGTVEDLYGGSDNDTLVGNGNPGVLEGGPGNDILDGGGGDDTLRGDSGFDTVSYAGRAGPVTVDLAAGTGGEAGETDDFDQADIENVTGGTGDDNLAGSDDVNILSGGPGNDTLDGRDGPDQLFGGEGDDTELGGPGADTLAGEPGNDNLQGDDDTDSLNGGDGDDALDGGAGADVLTGGAGNDTAMYESRTAAVDVTFDGANNDGESGEGDQVRLTTESTKTGDGNDTINAADGVKGDVSCGAGTDSVMADNDDVIASDCETKATVSALATCTVGSGLATMKKGTISVKVSCPTTGKGKLSLRTVGKAKRASKLGSKSLSLKAGKKKTVKIKLSKKAKRLLKRHKGSLRAHATISLKGTATASRTIKKSDNLTILAPQWRK